MELTLTDWENAYKNYLYQYHTSDDAAHDIKHFSRVWKTCRYINAAEGNIADDLVLLTAAYFHDIITIPKNHPDRKKASELSADKALEILVNEFPEFPKSKRDNVAHAIHAHSFSAGVAPVTIEAKILQDADRMEALGAIGLARVFYTAGLNRSSLFHAEDPFAVSRTPDDAKYAIDHFELKLLRLPELMNTRTGKMLAQKNADYLRIYIEKLKDELEGKY